MRRRHRVALAAFVAVVLSVATASAASAHANLIDTVPAQSARIPSGSSPRTIVVQFDEAVHATATSVSVYDGAGRALARRGSQGARTGTRITAAVPTTLRDGTYVVVWHVVSEDGHPEHGAFTFVVGAGGASRADIGQLLADQSSGRAIGVLFGIARAIAFLGALVIVGGLTFLVWRWRAASAWREVRAFIADAGVAALVATIASVPLQAAYSTGVRGNLVDGGALGDVLAARFGQAAIARTALLVGLVVLARRGRAHPVVVAVLGGLTMATFAFAGHGYTGPWPVGAFVLDVAHLGAAALWLGGLAALAVALRTRRDDVEVRDGAMRFSAVALPAITAVVVSGTVQGWRQIEGWSALWHTEYARLLVVKVLVLVGIVIVASAARDTLRERLAGGRELLEVRRGVAIELVLAVVVVGLTASLVVTAPAREADAAARRPTATTVRSTADGARVRYGVVVQPALPGDNTLVVSPALVGGGFLPAAMEATVRAEGSTTPKAATVTCTPLADGRWIAVVPLPHAGRWRVELVGSTGSSVDRATTTVTLRS